MSDESHTSVDDETLSAFLDGELAREDAERLERRLRLDPALAARLAELEGANARVRGAYARVVEEPLPERVLELLKTTPEAGGKIVPLAARAPRRAQTWVTFPTAIAAGIALAVGLALGLVAGSDLRTPSDAGALTIAGRVEPGTNLHAALESSPSAATRELPGGVTATPRLTFVTTDGAYCRRIDLTSARGVTASLACRRAGEWQVAVATFAVQAADGAGGVYRPAAAGAAAVEDAIDALIDGPPLSLEDEQAAIERGWTNASQ